MTWSRSELPPSQCHQKRGGPVYWPVGVSVPRRKRIHLLKTASVVILLCVSYFLGFTCLRRPQLCHHAEAGHWCGSSPSLDIALFWKDLAAALTDAEPKVEEIRPPYGMDRSQFDPHNPHHRLGVDIVRVPQNDIDTLTTAHQLFVNSTRDLVPRLPFRRDTHGVVMTADKDLLGVAITSLLMLRRSGSQLPAEVFLSSASDHVIEMCNHALADLDARCIDIEPFLRLPPEPNSTAPPSALPLERYQFKAFALLFSTFQAVLFLDADAFPVHNPDHLLSAEPFASHGMVTWPDFWLPTVSPLFWAAAATKPPPPVTVADRCTESGIMLLDKAVAADVLLLAAYYNLYGPGVYYPLQSQGAWGEGDKETFRLAARVLGRPAWHVGVAPEMMSDEALNDGSGIRQVDPYEDWVWRQRVTTGAEKGEVKERSGEEDKRREEDEIKLPRWMFAHTNRVKIDARRLNGALADKIYRQVDGKFSRLWGSDSGTLIDAAGYDIERAVWEEVINADCRQSYLEDCEKIRDYFDSVFAP